MVFCEVSFTGSLFYSTHDDVDGHRRGGGESIDKHALTETIERHEQRVSNHREPIVHTNFTLPPPNH